MDDEREVEAGAAQALAKRPTKTLKNAERRTRKILREAKDLSNTINLPELRMCRGNVKLRDAEGVVLRDEAGVVLTRPCKRRAIRGGTVCPYHGGSAPQVKKKAERRLNAMLEPSIIRLDELAHQNEHLPTALGAILAIQNRVLGHQGKGDGDKDTRPVINIGIAVGGIDTSAPKVAVNLIPAATRPPSDVAEGEVAEDDDEQQ